MKLTTAGYQGVGSRFAGFHGFMWLTSGRAAAKDALDAVWAECEKRRTRAMWTL